MDRDELIPPDGASEPEIPLTSQYVVPENGRRRLAWAAVRFTLLASGGQRLFYGAIVAFALVAQTIEGWSPFGEAARDVVELVVAGLTLSVVWACTVGFSQTYQSTRYRSPVGAVLSSGFGEDVFVLDGPTGEVRVPYAAVTRVRVRGDYVFFSTDRFGGHAIFPRALFPDYALARLPVG